MYFLSLPTQQGALLTLVNQRSMLRPQENYSNQIEYCETFAFQGHWICANELITLNNFVPLHPQAIYIVEIYLMIYPYRCVPTIW